MSVENPPALEPRAREGARQFSPSAARNAAPIVRAFIAHMPKAGVCVEVGSGTGEHVAQLAANLPLMLFRPGDPDAAARASIAAWTAHAGLSNIAPPHAADVGAPGWADAFAPADALLSINMIHIAPRAAMEGLMEGAGAMLRRGGRLFLYGPFTREGAHIASSNADFDAALKARDPRFGVRDIERDVAPLAASSGLGMVALVAMPANNFSAVFEKR